MANIETVAAVSVFVEKRSLVWHSRGLNLFTLFLDTLTGTFRK